MFDELMTIDDCQTVMALDPCVAPPLEGVEINVPLFHFLTSLFRYYFKYQVHILWMFLKFTSIMSNIMMGGCKVFISRQSRRVANLPI